MNKLTIYEFEALTAENLNFVGEDGVHQVPARVFAWLEDRCIQVAEEGDGAWLRWAQRRGRRVIQVTSYVGVIRSPDGFQIEVLPKVGKAIQGGIVESRRLLIEMLSCLHGFRHIKTEKALLCASQMPLLEIFISDFLLCVEQVVKRGLRSDYREYQGNLFALRGKLLLSNHLRSNIFRADRFFTQHDEFSTDRPENRLLRKALLQVLLVTKSCENQKLARELNFAFADIPPSQSVHFDFQRVRLVRGMMYYADALSWAKLILNDESPLTGLGRHGAPSLLFPMESLFEAFVAKHLEKQLSSNILLKKQVQGNHLVTHRNQQWFRLKPDLLLKNGQVSSAVLDTKWKLIDGLKANRKEKYGLSQADFYQLYAYGQSYLEGQGDLALIYPKTSSLDQPLPVFDFLNQKNLRLWVLPFCLNEKRLLLPSGEKISANFNC